MASPAEFVTHWGHASMLRLILRSCRDVHIEPGPTQSVTGTRSRSTPAASTTHPVTGIREAEEGTGPTGAGDGNPATVGDPTFSPLGAPASNLNGPNFTPPFPAYPSGHAGFGGALFQILRKFYSADSISFTFVSDEFNGVTLDNHGNVRPLIPRSFSSLSQAEEENDQSRIYLGIHWAFDKTDGIAQGRQVADYVFENAFVPLQRTTRRSR